MTTATRSSRSSTRAADSVKTTDPDSSKSKVQATSRKRKHGESASNHIKQENASIKQEDVKQEESSTPTRRSPRKAAKLDAETTPKKAKRTPAKRIKGPNGEITVQPPSNWERIWEVTAAMRKRVEAPVDTMGCESLADETRSPEDQRLQTLIALMLSSQTKDTVTAVAIKNLQDNLPGGFCLDSLLKVEPENLNELISKVGFHNNKTKYIKQTAEILRDKFNGDIPDTIEGLVSLPGVGPKMAYLTMSAAWDRHEGIGVDVHVHRITNLWKWHSTSTPEQTRAELESWLPKDKWHDINHLLVGFGQTICPPVGRKCDNCDLSALRLCPSAVKGRPAVAKTTFRKLPIDVEHNGDMQIVKVKVEQDQSAVSWNMETPHSGLVEFSDRIGGQLPDIQTLRADRPGVNYIDYST